MYRIVNTTDGKYIGRVINEIADNITFADGFIMHVEHMKTVGEYIEISNFNYIITLKSIEKNV